MELWHIASLGIGGGLGLRLVAPMLGGMGQTLLNLARSITS